MEDAFLPVSDPSDSIDQTTSGKEGTKSTVRTVLMSSLTQPLHSSSQTLARPWKTRLGQGSQPCAVMKQPSRARPGRACKPTGIIGPPIAAPCLLPVYSNALVLYAWQLLILHLSWIQSTESKGELLLQLDGSI